MSDMNKSGTSGGLLGGHPGNGYYHFLRWCRKDDEASHDECPGRLDPTSSFDPHPTVCMCCDHGHYRGLEDDGSDAQVRHTEWRPGRNWVREGDRVKVKGIRGICTFLALLTNGEDLIEVRDENARVKQVRPEDVRRLAKTKHAPRGGA